MCDAARVNMAASDAFAPGLVREAVAAQCPSPTRAFLPYEKERPLLCNDSLVPQRGDQPLQCVDELPDVQPVNEAMVHLQGKT